MEMTAAKMKRIGCKGLRHVFLRLKVILMRALITPKTSSTGRNSNIPFGSLFTIILVSEGLSLKSPGWW